MLRVRLICVGKLKESFYIDACREYQKRLQRYCDLEILELPETGSLERDGAAVLEKVPSGALLAALCVEGKLYSSQELADLVNREMNSGTSRLCLVIGGSDGLWETVKQRAEVKISLSRMTFPHHLARVIVLEQLYRAFNILSGGKYHK